MSTRQSRISGRIACLTLVILLLGALSPAYAAEADDRLHQVFPAAEGIGPAEGTPPARPAFRGSTLLGYVFSSREAGYAARPLDILIGLDRDCRIAGVELVEQHEPILMLGLPETALADFIRQYVGLDIAQRVHLDRAAPAEGPVVQAISRATISSFALHDAILGAARQVARSRGLACMVGGAGPRLNLGAFMPESWQELLGDGSVASLHITAARAAEALHQAGMPQPAAATLPADADFATLYTALATPAQIGANLLGRSEYTALLRDAPPDSNLVFIGGTGFQSFKGSSYRRAGSFDRIQIVQGERSITLTTAQHHPVERLRATGAPELREIAVFLLPLDTGFRPEQPWRLQFAVTEARPEGGPAVALFTLPYTLPQRYLLPAPATPPVAGETASEPVWQRVWQAKPGQIIVLGAALLGLYLVFALQDQVARRKRFWSRLRIGALIFTLLWLGWYAGAQLSVLHVLTFLEALRTRFDWGSFLLDPLAFILWSWVAIALAFWGRGAFCGWLCPFGALQELANRLAQRLRVPQLAVPFTLHERLWPTKYVIFFALFAISLGSMTLATTAAEEEPFKTAIILRFVRWWPFVLYGVAILVASLFVERFFCRYLCPLGAALALPARLRMFEWLKRHRQCGTECQICAIRCPVQAIHPDGHINPNECVYCMKCQTLYFDEETCPALVTRRQRREARAALRRAGASGGGSA